MKGLFAALMFLALSVHADVFGDWQYLIENGEATITGYAGSGGEVIVPGQLGGAPVKTFGAGDLVFADPNVPVSLLTFPEGLTRIGDFALAYCVNLPGVTFPESVVEIGQNAFYGCAGLKHVDLGRSVAWIGSAAFASCPSLEAISVNPENASFTSEGGVLYAMDKTVLYVYPPAALGDGTFSVPSGVTRIGDWAFDSCAGLVEIMLPEGLESIGAFAFQSCTGLTSLSIPASVTQLGSFAFKDCAGLVEVLFLGVAPDTSGLWDFGPAVVYCLEEAPGWGASYSGKAVNRVSKIPLAITSGTQTDTIPLGADYTYRIMAKGVPSAFAAKGLPPGLQVNAKTGVISGKPNRAGAYRVVLQALRQGSPSAALSKTLQITQAPDFSYPSPVRVKAQNAVQVRPRVVGYPPPAFSVVSGVLPAGLKINPANGTLTGKAKQRGTYAVTVRAASSAGTADQPAIIVVRTGQSAR